MTSKLSLLFRTLLVAALAAFFCVSGSAQDESTFLRAKETMPCADKIQAARERPKPDRDLAAARCLESDGENENAVVWFRQSLSVAVSAAPRRTTVWYELGEALARSQNTAGAAKAFESALRLTPGNTGAEFGLALADAKLGRYNDALAAYGEVLAKSPANYDALQGKAFALYWSHQFGESQRIFKRLALLNPQDQENPKALVSIAGAMDQDRWAAMRPPHGAPPQAWLGYYTSYLANHPNDSAAREALARTEAQFGMYPDAIREDQHALRLDRSNESAQQSLARVLSWNHQFAASVETYNGLLSEQPRNREALEGLERVFEWSGRPKDALATELRLLALDPASADDLQAVVRLEFATKDSRAGEASLARMLLHHPHDRWALLEMARLQVRQGRLQTGLSYYDDILADDFNDPDALYGEARIYYFLGNPDRAEPLAARSVAQRPADFDALLLYARIERAMRHRKKSLALVHRASLLNPASPEIAALKAEIVNDHRVTVHTTSAYARELAFQNVSPYGVRYASPGLIMEDLNTYSSAVRTGFSFLPRTDSYVLLAATPSNSPFGGIQGAVAPSELMYGQTTRISKWMSLRGGFGGVRMGPGEIYDLAAPSPPTMTPTIVPVGYFGYSAFPTRKLSLDFSASRTALTYTPTSVRFGAVETRIEGAINYEFDSRTRVGASYYHNRDSSAVYEQPNLLAGGIMEPEKNGRDHGDGGTVVFNRSLIRSERFSLDAGYSGLAFGYAGAKNGVFMGFFNPAFYQSHFLTTRAQGMLWGPVQYTLIGDAGIQQAAEGAPLTRAFRVGPSVSLHVSRTLSLTLGYLHYNFAQSLGSVRGNEVELETDWRF
ncbi:MAG: tetratricopeptide repeat protein [Terriglobia bacterium]